MGINAIEKSYDTDGGGATDYLLSVGNKGMATSVPDTEGSTTDGTLDQLVNPPSVTCYVE